MLHINSRITIDERDLKFTFVRASGPGGQNVNKLATAAQLRFDTHLLPAAERERLYKIAPGKINNEGELIIDARRFRTQERNRADALERLEALLRKAATKPKPRKKTKPTKASKKRRMESKTQRGKIKRLRGKPGME